MDVAIKPGVVRGTAVIRDKHGNVKGQVSFEGETRLSKAELEARGLKFTNTDGDNHGRDPDNRSA